MKWITHQTGAVLLATCMQFPLAGIIGAGLGSVMPDLIDQRVSGLGLTRRQKQKIFNRIHRGASHWFGWWLLGALPLFLFPVAPILNDLAIGLAMGALSHIVLDMLTPQGVPVLPFTRKNRLSFNMCATGSFGEYLFLAWMAACAVIWLAHTNRLESLAKILLKLQNIF